MLGSLAAAHVIIEKLKHYVQAYRVDLLCARSPLLSQATQQVVMSASVAETSLFAKFKVLEENTLNRQNFTHGQYKDSGMRGTFETSPTDMSP